MTFEIKTDFFCRDLFFDINFHSSLTYMEYEKKYIKVGLYSNALSSNINNYTLITEINDYNYATISIKDGISIEIVDEYPVISIQEIIFTATANNWTNIQIIIFSIDTRIIAYYILDSPVTLALNEKFQINAFKLTVN